MHPKDKSQKDNGSPLDQHHHKACSPHSHNCNYHSYRSPVPHQKDHTQLIGNNLCCCWEFNWTFPFFCINTEKDLLYAIVHHSVIQPANTCLVGRGSISRDSFTCWFG
ncbi:Hypothetical predicted protein [Marmota monax]|uniref:Uncharacterized protein n=1 Tax=Marmota monax TaxID=9995 RepID=A0A5E4AXZ0_MARMO|nr:hypothetical protein GHT09_015241 [Marmota monax]VTJ61409.1 Hypothetical predicted protein [Marmota monax]